MMIGRSNNLLAIKVDAQLNVSEIWTATPCLFFFLNEKYLEPSTCALAFLAFFSLCPMVRCATSNSEPCSSFNASVQSKCTRTYACNDMFGIDDMNGRCVVICTLVPGASIMETVLRDTGAPTLNSSVNIQRSPSEHILSSALRLCAGTLYSCQPLPQTNKIAITILIQHEVFVLFLFLFLHAASHEHACTAHCFFKSRSTR